jgi:hypothetical protein
MRQSLYRQRLYGFHERRRTRNRQQDDAKKQSRQTEKRKNQSRFVNIHFFCIGTLGRYSWALLLGGAHFFATLSIAMASKPSRKQSKSRKSSMRRNAHGRFKKSARNPRTGRFQRKGTRKNNRRD